MSEHESGSVEIFRRRRFEAPHRRRHPLRRLLRPFAAALVVVGGPAVATWWVATSPELEIREIDVVSTPRVPGDWTRERLEPLVGRHLLTVRLTEIEGRLAGHPWIADLIVRRELPGRLEVEPVERSPAALWNGDGGLVILDAEGRAIAPLAGGGAHDLPVLSSAGGQEEPDPVAAAAAIRVVDRWEKLRPGDRVSQLEILPSGDFRLVTTVLPFTVVVSADRLEAAPAALARVGSLIESHQLPMPPGTRAASVDLRFSRQIVFQPAALPPREEG